MDLSPPTDDDMMRCAGCGSLECDSTCPEFWKLEAKEMYRFYPHYCPKTKLWYCGKCHTVLSSLDGKCPKC